MLAADLDDQIGEAIPLGDLSTPKLVAGAIEQATDVDMYAFQVAAGQVVDLDVDTATNGVPGLGSLIRIFDSSGRELAANNDAQAPGEPQPPPGGPHFDSFFDSYIRYTFPAAGTYYIGVSNWLNDDYDPIGGEGDIAGDQHLTGAFTLTVSSPSTAPDLYLDRGADGLWAWTSGVGLAQLSPADPEGIAVAPDGTPYFDFGPYGLWTRIGSDFLQVNLADPQAMAAAPDGSLYIDYGDYGLWRLSGGDFTPLHAADPEAIAPAPDGSVYLDYGRHGLWRNSDAGFTPINAADPRLLAAAADGSLYVDFGSFGLWRWDGAGMLRIFVAGVEGLVAAPGDGVFIDDGSSGLFLKTTTAFTRLVPDDPEGMVAGLDGFLYLDFGPSGVWRRGPSGIFEQVTIVDAQAIA